MTKTEHLADLFKRLGMGRLDVADELAKVLAPSSKVADVVVDLTAPEVEAIAEAIVPAKKKAK